MKSEFEGSISEIRAIEDSIRATHKYTEGIGTLRAKHPIQGEDFASKLFCKYYEVYPYVKVSMDMPVGQAIDLFWGDTLCVDVRFRYDYRTNKASAAVKNGAMKVLSEQVPGFSAAIAMIVGSNGNSKAVKN